MDGIYMREKYKNIRILEVCFMKNIMEFVSFVEIG